jgi:sulfonate transport system substrate-binding protein
MTRGMKGALVVVFVLFVSAAGLSSWYFAHRPAPAAVQEATAKVIEIGTFSTAIDYSPYYIAKNQGWLEEVAKKHGVSFTYRVFDALPSINDALASGKLDIIMEAETPAIIQQASGNELVEIAPLASLVQEIVVPIDSPVQNLTDLKGKRIGVLLGTGFHYGLVSAMSALGIPPESYTVVNLAPAEAGAALSAKTIDAWAVWPPFPQQEVVAGTGKTIPSGKGRVYSLMFGTREFVEKNNPSVRDVVDAIERARKFIAAKKEGAISIVASATALPDKVVSLAWSKMDFQMTVTPEAIAEMQSEADFLYKGSYIVKQSDLRKTLFAVPAAAGSR